jgi:hypothetical protein
MPKYRITAPDGNTYEITAPEGATEQEVLAYAQSNYKQPPEPAKAVAAEQPRSVLQDLQRQAAMTGRTAYEAFTAPATAVLDFGAGLYNLGANLVGSQSRAPLASQAQSEMLTRMGAPAPETTAEKFAQGAISGMAGQAGLAKVAPAAAGNLARAIPAAGAGGAVAQPVAETVTDITGNPLAGFLTGAGASLVAGGAAGKAGRMVEPRVETFSIPEIKARAAANYSKMDEAGITVKPQSATGMINSIKTELDNNNFIPKTDTKIANALETFQEVIGKDNVSFNKIEKLRSIASNLSNDPDANTKRLGRVMVEGVDNYISSLNGKDIVAGKEGLDKAVQAVMSARKDWRAASKAQVIQDVFDVAQMRAENPKKSDAELIRTQLEGVLANKGKRNMFTTAELNAMKSVVGGGPVENLLSIIARFDPRKSHLSAGATGGAVIYDPVIGGALAGGGIVSESLLGVMKRRQVEDLIRGVASGTIKEQPNYKYQGLLGGFMAQ